MLATASAALLGAGCGGQGPSSPQAAGGPSRSIDAAYKYARCMRQHGVASFSDPRVINEPGHQAVGIHITPAISGSPQFKTAQHACRGIMPDNTNGPSPQERAARLKGLLGFASCMRTHHVPTFPDPNSQGQLRPETLTAAGIDLHAPAVRAAARECVPASDGQVSAAQVAQAVGAG
jgi:hypothetical protein